MNRRKFCVSSIAAAIAGASASAAAGTSRPMSADSAPPIRFYKFLYDRRYPAGRAFGDGAGRAGSTAGVVAIHGDITAFWSLDLQPQWSAGGGVIAGMTTARTLFCLEQLAKDHWMRVVVRAEHALSEGHEIIHRLTAAEPMISRMRSALMTEDWPRKMPAVMATCRGVDAASRPTRVIRSASGLRFGATDDMLVSFVIA